MLKQTDYMSVSSTVSKTQHPPLLWTGHLDCRNFEKRKEYNKGKKLNQSHEPPVMLQKHS